MTEGLYLTAKEAAEELGVSVSTLYAYVSRHRLRSVEQEGKSKTRNRRYWRADIERLKTRKRGEQEWPIAADTSITLLTADRFFYRGENVQDLATKDTFEKAVAILWGMKESDVFSADLPPVPRQFRKLVSATTGMNTPNRLISLLPSFEQCNPKAYDLSTEGFARSGAGVVRLYAAVLCGTKPSTESIHTFVANHLNAEPGFDDIIRRLLVLAADHELDPSTYAVRAMANTGATPHRAVITGLMAFDGRRLWAKAIDSTARLLNEILHAREPSEPILRRFRTGEEIPGFYVGLHEIEDPRPTHLITALADVEKDSEEFERLRTAIGVADEVAGVRPHMVLPVTYISRRLGLDESDMALFCLGRSAGWIAHASEQYQDHPLIRPKANYVGVLPRKGNAR